MSRIKQRLLEAIKPHVIFDGWTNRALRLACKDAGIAPESLRVELPGGVDELLGYYLEQADEQMALDVATYALETLPIRERIATIIRTRLERHTTEKEVVRRTVAYLSLPIKASLSLKYSYRTIDRMWRLAGDKSTDFSYYTRRLTLASIYGGTLLHWLNDESPNHQSTEAYLRQSIDRVMQFTKLKGKCVASLQGLSLRFPRPFSQKN
jgi:ubiquinone biosynthesis protein COQ9